MTDKAQNSGDPAEQTAKVCAVRVLPLGQDLDLETWQPFAGTSCVNPNYMNPFARVNDHDELDTEHHVHYVFWRLRQKV